MLAQSLNVVKWISLTLLCLALSRNASAQNYVMFSPYGYTPRAISAPYVAPYPASYVRSVTVARYPVATLQVVAPAPVVAVPFYTSPPALVRPVVVRPKYYVPYQPIRNTVRAITP